MLIRNVKFQSFFPHTTEIFLYYHTIANVAFQVCFFYTFQSVTKMLYVLFIAYHTNKFLSHLYKISFWEKLNVPPVKTSNNSENSAYWKPVPLCNMQARERPILFMDSAEIVTAYSKLDGNHFFRYTPLSCLGFCLTSIAKETETIKKTIRVRLSQFYSRNTEELRNEITWKVLNKLMVSVKQGNWIFWVSA